MILIHSHHSFINKLANGHLLVLVFGDKAATKTDEVRDLQNDFLKEEYLKRCMEKGKGSEVTGAWFLSVSPWLSQGKSKGTFAFLEIFVQHPL